MTRESAILGLLADQYTELAALRAENEQLSRALGVVGSDAEGETDG